MIQQICEQHYESMFSIYWNRIFLATIICDVIIFDKFIQFIVNSDIASLAI